MIFRQKFYKFCSFIYLNSCKLRLNILIFLEALFKYQLNILYNFFFAPLFSKFVKNGYYQVICSALLIFLISKHKISSRSYLIRRQTSCLLIEIVSISLCSFPKFNIRLSSKFIIAPNILVINSPLNSLHVLDRLRKASTLDKSVFEMDKFFPFTCLIHYLNKLVT